MKRIVACAISLMGLVPVFCQMISLSKASDAEYYISIQSLHYPYEMKNCVVTINTSQPVGILQQHNEEIGKFSVEHQLAIKNLASLEKANFQIVVNGKQGSPATFDVSVKLTYDLESEKDPIAIRKSFNVRAEHIEIAPVPKRKPS